MAGRKYDMQFRRRRECKTDYGNRLTLLKSGKTRAVVRRSSENMIIQFVNYDPKGDVIISSTSTQDLKKLGWQAGTGNVPASYLAGLLAGARAKKKGVSEAILDMGSQRGTKGSRIFAALKGMIESGIIIPHSKEVLPSDDRTCGKHIADWSQKAQGQFSKYKVSPADIAAHFSQTKEKIMGGE